MLRQFKRYAGKPFEEYVQCAGGNRKMRSRVIKPFHLSDLQLLFMSIYVKTHSIVREREKESADNADFLLSLQCDVLGNFVKVTKSKQLHTVPQMLKSIFWI